ncbi:hypothetical protein [Microbacterium sp. CFBP9034]|uniref:hypothetical protein n=1 Tax=Microbacterium sp. CFBP9034 TaxID=3096540 RepID=UPI002A6A38F7|nr:hypothetical protein [Microbacterium sp. CFBP9034]MDY0908704.1 hypothetical protein [Microbacterium sp. CFBP9034]
MSNPTEPTPPNPSDAPQPPADAQPTEIVPPSEPVGDAQPTAAYPPSDFQATEAYPPADQPGYGQAPQDPAAYGQPPYGQPPAYDPAYGQAPVAAPVSPDARPRTLGWISLGLALGGLLLVGAAFIPLLWVSLVLAFLGGLLLLIALVLGIVTLASKKQGGKGLGIAAIALSVVGGIAWIGAITLAFLLIGFAAVGTSNGASVPSPAVSQEAVPEDEPTEEGSESETPTGTYDEAAYLAQVRPELTALMQEIEPSITEEMLAQTYTDETLVSIGQSLLIAGETGRSVAITSLTEASGGMFTEEQATRFYDTIADAAEQYLVQ